MCVSILAFYCTTSEGDCHATLAMTLLELGNKTTNVILSKARNPYPSDCHAALPRTVFEIRLQNQPSF